MRWVVKRAMRWRGRLEGGVLCSGESYPQILFARLCITTPQSPQLIDALAVFAETSKLGTLARARLYNGPHRPSSPNGRRRYFIAAIACSISSLLRSRLCVASDQ